jgi:hypothetical protein
MIRSLKKEAEKGANFAHCTRDVSREPSGTSRALLPACTAFRSGGERSGDLKGSSLTFYLAGRTKRIQTGSWQGNGGLNMPGRSTA